MPVSSLIRGGMGMPGSTSRDIVATCSTPSIRTAPISTMRALAPTPGGLEVDDRPGGVGQRRRGRRREADEADAAVVMAHEARVVVDDLLEHAARELARHARQREQRARGALGREWLAALLDQRREPVGRAQLQLELRRARPARRWRPACHANTCSHVGGRHLQQTCFWAGLGEAPSRGLPP